MQYFMELKIGLFNAWIGSAITIIIMGAGFANKEAAKRLGDTSWYTAKTKIIATVNMIFSYGTMILSIWVPLKTGTPWFYVGLIIFIIGMITYLIANHNYVTTPGDEAIVKGMYRISRNPLYAFFGIMLLGITIASASLPLLILWILNIIFTQLIILEEEGYCLKTYGDSYQEYMQRVPRWLLIF